MNEDKATYIGDGLWARIFEGRLVLTKGYAEIILTEDETIKLIDFLNEL